jgi:hypothetical protein
VGKCIYCNRLINTLQGNSSVNTVRDGTIVEAVFSMYSAPSRGGTTGLCNPLLGTGSISTFASIGPNYESGDVINNRDGVFHGSVRSAYKRSE